MTKNMMENDKAEQKNKGGRPPVERKCPKCGKLCRNARGALAHCTGRKDR